MKIICVKNGLSPCMINDEDESIVKPYNWFAHEGGYVAAFLTRQEFMYLHRYIMCAIQGQMVDHIDGNKYNNQRSNLRFTNFSENRNNSKMNCNNTSGYRGVGFQGNCPNPWRVQFVHQKKLITVGNFATIEEAAHAYDKRVLQLKGPLAKLNFPR